MTPEWSKRAGLMLQSPYWTPEVGSEKDQEGYFRLLNDELFPLQDALLEAEDYDDLDGNMREIFDRAEAAAKELQDAIRNDEGGYSRFLGTEVTTSGTVGTPTRTNKSPDAPPRAAPPPS